MTPGMGHTRLLIRFTSDLKNQLDIPGRGNKPQTVQINMLRQWKTSDARVLRVVIADVDEDKEDHHTKTRQDEEVLDTDQRKELEEILFTFTGVINPIPGRVHLLQHSINTRDSPPLRIAPHRLLLKWKDQLYTEVKDLLEAGIHQTVHGFPSN